jgi:hypothetical protein
MPDSPRHDLRRTALLRASLVARVAQSVAAGMSPLRRAGRSSSAPRKQSCRRRPPDTRLVVDQRGQTRQAIKRSRAEPAGNAPDRRTQRPAANQAHRTLRRCTNPVRPPLVLASQTTCGWVAFLPALRLVPREGMEAPRRVSAHRSCRGVRRLSRLLRSCSSHGGSVSEV